MTDEELLLIGGALTAGAVLLLYSRGYSVRFKHGVVLALAPEMSRALPAIEAAHQAAGVTRGAFITSGTDGAHRAGSLHYVGKALDLRTRDLMPAQIVALLSSLKRLLGAAYDVVDESRTLSPHIHVEYDPRV